MFHCWATAFALSRSISEQATRSRMSNPRQPLIYCLLTILVPIKPILTFFIMASPLSYGVLHALVNISSLALLEVICLPDNKVQFGEEYSQERRVSPHPIVVMC